MSFLTVPEVADKLRTSPMTIYRLIRAGEMPATRAGKKFLIDEVWLDEFLERNVYVAPQDRA